MLMNSSPSRLAVAIFLICSTTVVIHLSWNKAASDSSFAANSAFSSSPKASHEAANDGLQNVQNRTLGFQEVRVITMPGRSDRKDAWTVTTSASEFDVVFVDGVEGDKVPAKALPYTMNQKVGIIGCWRAHMNVLADMINRKVSSMLVFEDDADWDVALKSQLVQLARGSRWLLNSTSPQQTTSLSPYGDGWDILWLGHCGARADPWDNRRFVIPDDPTVEPEALRSYGASPDMRYWQKQDRYETQTRLVMSQYYGVCTASYAVSLSGAKKILYHLSMSLFNGPIDWGLSDLCKHKNSSFTCIAPYPPLIGIHHPAGPKSSWSDIDPLEGTDEVARSERVVFSTRQNMDRILNGLTAMKSPYVDFTNVEEMDIKDIGKAVGHPEVIEMSEQDAAY